MQHFHVQRERIKPANTTGGRRIADTVEMERSLLWSFWRVGERAPFLWLDRIRGQQREEMESWWTCMRREGELKDDGGIPLNSILLSAALFIARGDK